MNKSETFLYLNSNGSDKDYLFFGAESHLEIDRDRDTFESLESYISDGEWTTGYFSYDLKNELEDLSSNNPYFIPAPDIFFFKPEIVLEISGTESRVLKGKNSSSLTEALAIITKFTRTLYHFEPPEKSACLSMSQEKYLAQVALIKEHIQVGDIYEANFCQEFKIENCDLDPTSAYRYLNEKSGAPYSCYFRMGKRHLLCASPESFLTRKGTQVESRPMKGTRKRASDPTADEALKNELEQDVKERAENIMITDLVRNDLSRTAKINSVKVAELCKIHSYDTVHQMVSRVVSEVEPSMSSVEILKTCFPMGSMTGAPKIRAMEIIDDVEDFKRGLYSGAVGFFSPNGDFSFNVVIRSILYDDHYKRASVAAGGAITALSDPEKEYEESMLKAKVMLEVLGVDKVNG